MPRNKHGVGLKEAGTFKTGTFLGQDPSDENIDWSESKIQIFIIQEARRAGHAITASQERAKRSKGAGARAKAEGMTAGLPDLMVWLSGGILLIELKTSTGKVSHVQKEFHKTLCGLGYVVHLVFAKTPKDGWDKVKMLIDSQQMKI